MYCTYYTLARRELTSELTPLMAAVDARNFWHDVYSLTAEATSANALSMVPRINLKSSFPSFLPLDLEDIAGQLRIPASHLTVPDVLAGVRAESMKMRRTLDFLVHTVRGLVSYSPTTYYNTYCTAHPCSS